MYILIEGHFWKVILGHIRNIYKHLLPSRCIFVNLSRLTLLQNPAMTIIEDLMISLEKMLCLFCYVLR